MFLEKPGVAGCNGRDTTKRKRHGCKKSMPRKITLTSAAGNSGPNIQIEGPKVLFLICLGIQNPGMKIPS